MSAAELRILAHPLRIRLLQLLREGPSTASELGRRLGESSGATSYHLRALHRAGMIEEDDRRNDRERWWRRTTGFLLVPNSIPPDADEAERAEFQAAHAKIESVFVDRDEQALARWESIRYDLPLEWQDAVFLGGFRIWANATEVNELLRRILELTDPYRERRTDDGAREVHFTLRMLVQEDGDPGAGGN